MTYTEQMNNLRNEAINTIKDLVIYNGTFSLDKPVPLEVPCGFFGATTIFCDEIAFVEHEDGETAHIAFHGHSEEHYSDEEVQLIDDDGEFEDLALTFADYIRIADEAKKTMSEEWRDALSFAGISSYDSVYEMAEKREKMLNTK